MFGNVVRTVLRFILVTSYNITSTIQSRLYGAIVVIAIRFLLHFNNILGP